jgi:hypothetical protein
MLENPVYTGRLYWNRLDFRATKQGEGPLVRRAPEEWIEAERRHEALISGEDFERVQAEMRARSTGQAGNRRRRAQNRFYLLRGIVHCATGHNPPRMQGKTRKGNTYYACGYRISYGDKAAEATGHGKWQYVREESVLALIDGFFATRVFGPDRLAYLRSDQAALAATLPTADDDGEHREAKRRLSDVEQRIERQLAAIEAGVDPIVVGERIRILKSEREEVEVALAQLAQTQQEEPIDIEKACAVLDSLPDLSEPLAEADPKLRHAVYEAFRLRVEIDRNAQQIRLKALVSSAFSQVKGLSDFVAGKAIAGERFGSNSDLIVPIEWAADLAPQAKKKPRSYEPIRVPRRDVPKKSP